MVNFVGVTVHAENSIVDSKQKTPCERNPQGPIFVSNCMKVSLIKTKINGNLTCGINLAKCLRANHHKLFKNK